MKKKKFDKSVFKKNPQELELWLHLRKAGSRIENKKGKGSYQRKSKWGVKYD